MNSGKFLATMAGFAVLAGLAYHQVRVIEPRAEQESELVGATIDVQSRQAATVHESASANAPGPGDCDGVATGIGNGKAVPCDTEIAIEDTAENATEIFDG